MLSNYWNPPFSYLIIIKKDVCRNLSKLISLRFTNHPGTYTDRGEKLWWQKHNLNLINYNFSNYISASILTQNSFYVWKENLWCIFENHSASPNFSPPRTYWRKIDAQPAQAKTFPSKMGHLQTAVIFFLWVAMGQNIKIEMLIFTKIRGFLPRNFVSLKLIFSEIHEKF